MQYLLNEEEYAEYQALKTADTAPLTVVGETDEEHKMFLSGMFLNSRFETYERVAELNRRYISFEIPLEVIPDDLVAILKQRRAF